MRKRKQTELVSFKACVVETETYDNGNGKLYHATLDSLPSQPQRQAHFLGLQETFKAGDIHIVTFSACVGKSKRRVKEQNQEAAQEQRVRAAHAFKKAMEEYEKSDLIN